MTKLFGTDGIRGRAGTPPLTESIIRSVSRSVGRRLAAKFTGAPFLIARDTRLSGPWIRDFVIKELHDLSIPVLDAGVLPTPAAAVLIPRRDCMGGLVISASHNPAEDNGLKFLTNEGTKLPAEFEEAVESDVAETLSYRDGQEEAVPVFPLFLSDFESNPECLKAYLSHLLGHFSLEDLSPSTRIVLDCANGAMAPVVKALVGKLDSGIIPIHADPDGMNINLACGATCPEVTAQRVVDDEAAWGITLDGDGDRIIVSDRHGRILDGDALLYIFACSMDSMATLRHRTVVGTVMTNMGLETALAKQGLALIRTPVGDRHIQSRMRADNLTLGGEPSGHIILGHLTNTGDGLLAAMFLLHILAQTGSGIDDLLEGFVPFPSQIVNVNARWKPPLNQVHALDRLREVVADESHGNGRVVIRYSGTEPLLRIFIEARELPRIMTAVDPLIREIEDFLGNSHPVI